LTPDGVESYLHEHIPLSAGMGLRVIEASEDRIVVEAPLDPNVNHRETAFGGSVAALGILAGWTQVHLRLRREGCDAHTVIQESAVRYHGPIHGAFRATSERVDQAAWDRFTRTLARRGRGRVRLTVRVEADGVLVATFRGSYVALARR